jgi:YHS domain-containing protein
MSKKITTIAGLSLAATIFLLISCGTANTQQLEKTKIQKTATDPVCGMTVNKDIAKTKGLTTDYMGTTYYFCRTEDRDAFVKNPAQFVKAQENSSSGGQSSTEPSPAPAASTESQKAASQQTFTCPVCGMTVEASVAKSSNLVASYMGKDYYFCSASDKEKFEKDPGKYVK